MSVIVVSLFLPYTAKFEVPEEISIDPHDLCDSKPQANSNSEVSTDTHSILPTLRKGLSKTSKTDPKNPSEDGFFRRRLKSSANLTEDGHLIQPKPRTMNLHSSVVEKRQDNELSSTPSLKVNVSSTNLVNASSTTSLNLLSNANRSKSKPQRKSSSYLSKPIFNFTNASNNSLSETNEDTPPPIDSFQEIDADDWQHQFNDLVHGRVATRLTPFGGFSKTMNLFNDENIFESVPWKVVYNESGNGSLIKAIKISSDEGIIKKKKWVGTLAMPSDAVPYHVLQDISQELQKSYNCEAIFPEDKVFEGHYKSFCKQILWPSLHYQIPDDPKSKAFEDHSWDQYYALNQMMADKAIETYEKQVKEGEKDPIIWVHDYHLMLVPKMIREKLPDAKIGFFLHVSFPSSEVFRVFATRKELLRGMLGANCISFQTNEYVRHFLQTASRLLLADANESGLTYEGHYTHVDTIPVGIDAPSLEEKLRSVEVSECKKHIRERWSKQKLIVSRDRLDKLRGIKQKLLAFESFLKDDPDRTLDTVLIQLCIGSNNDSAYEAEIMQIVSRINSMPENIQTQPVIFIQHDIEFEQYLALLCEADAFAVTSMREGLNLTCHEFILSTQLKQSPLILSEFTGSSNLLYCDGKGSLAINPWDVKGLAKTFHSALFMSKEDKRKHWETCFKIVLEQDAKNWVSKCLQSIQDSWKQEKSKSILQPFSQEILNNILNVEGFKLIFLNLETPTSVKVDSFSEPRLLNPLKDILNDPSKHIYITSYLRRSDLDILYGRNPNLGLIAENGGYVKLIGTTKWISLVEDNESENWIHEISRLVESKSERLPGSTVEIEDCTIRFHPGKALQEEPNRALDTIGELIQHVNEIGDEIHATLIRNTVVIQKHELSLDAVKFILKYYTSGEADGNQSFKMKMVSSTNELIQRELKPKDETIKSLLIAGGCSAIDEPRYEFASNLKTIENVVTVAVTNNENSSARYGVRGQNELLGMFSKVHSM